MTAIERKQQQKSIKGWQVGAHHDRDVAHSLFKNKHYDWSLFIFHLAIEKLLKALIVQIEATPPPIHKLVRLAEIAKLELSQQHRDWLTEITEFNIEARYDDDKLSFYKKATREYAERWHKCCEEIFLWLDKQIQ